MFSGPSITNEGKIIERRGMIISVSSLYALGDSGLTKHTVGKAGCYFVINWPRDNFTKVGVAIVE